MQPTALSTLAGAPMLGAVLTLGWTPVSGADADGGVVDAAPKVLLRNFAISLTTLPI